MGSRFLSLLKAFSILLAVSTSKAKGPSASCPPCNEYAVCYNSTHCVCKAGFQPISGKSYTIKAHVKCEDIDECATRTAKCKQISYCRNKIGSYICSCVVNFPFFNWVAGLIEIDQPECYENKERKTLPEVLGELRNNTTKRDFAQKVTQLFQNVEHYVWNESLASSRKGEISMFDIVYESKRCNKKTVLEAGNNTMSIDCALALKGAKSTDESSVALITYQSLGEFLDGSFFSSGRGMQGVELNSQVVSVTIHSEVKVDLSEPVSLTFQHTQTSHVRTKHFCVYWERRKEDGGWSTEGCYHTGSNDSYTMCKCSHLSSFAVLVALSLEEDFMLSVITCVGLSLSLLCLLLAALTFLLCRAIQNTSTTLHLQLSLCLFLAHLLFLTGINRTEPEALCSVIAGTLHFFYLAAFMWMFLEGLHLFLTVRNLKVANYTSTGRFKKRFMYPTGYGIPAFIVAVSASVAHENYGTYAHCWLSLEKGLIWSFLGPVAVIILINMAFYFQIMWILRSKLSSLNKEVSTIQDTKVMTFKAAVQLFVLGCSWGIGFFMVKEVGKTIGLIAAYLFTIINALQGVLIFVVHCLLNRQVRMEYKKWFRGMRKEVETESVETSRSTAHTKMEEPEKPTECSD